MSLEQMLHGHMVGFPHQKHIWKMSFAILDSNLSPDTSATLFRTSISTQI